MLMIDASVFLMTYAGVNEEITGVRFLSPHFTCCTWAAALCKAVRSSLEDSGVGYE